MKKLTYYKSVIFSLYQLDLVSRDENNFFRNKVKSVIKKQKAIFFKNYFRFNQKNIRNTWKMINTISNSNPNKSAIKAILWNNVEYTSDSQISDAFNEYFSSIPNLLENNLPSSNIDPLSFVNLNQISSMYLYPVCTSECLKIIKNLKNTKENIDSLPVFLFKQYADLLVHEMCDIINLSFKTGTFPDILKIAKVIPVYKKGDRSIISNYRPISVLTFFSKIFENCIHTRLVNFLNTNNSFYELQFGFRSGLSTSDAISNLVEYLYETLDKSQSAINVFIDFSRAFDTVNRNILFRKLQAYGIRGVALKLIISYFTNRKQYVHINGYSSSFKIIDIGIGQGTVLGPLFFLIFINDLPNISQNFRTILYADDSTFSFRGKDINSLAVTCNSELQKFMEWTRANRLSVNTDKTFYNIVTNSRATLDENFQIIMDNKPISRKRSIRFLGIILDENLKFKDHVSYVTSKISKSIGILYKLRCLVSEHTLRSLYYALVFPYLLYGNIVWGGTYVSHTQPVVILQKKIIRIISNVHFTHHTNDLFRNNNILKFQDIHFFVLCNFMFKNLNLAVFHSRSSHYNTRSENMLTSSFHRLSLTQHSIYFTGPIIWNSLPDSIKSSREFNVFRSLVKKYLIDSYVSV